MFFYYCVKCRKVFAFNSIAEAEHSDVGIYCPNCYAWRKHNMGNAEFNEADFNDIRLKRVESVE